jgi:hypothetical protein
VFIQDDVDANQHLYAKVRNLRLVTGVTKKILDAIPELEKETFYRPKAKKIAWFLSAGTMLQECTRTGRKTCIWYENLSEAQVRPDWAKTWKV